MSKLMDNSNDDNPNYTMGRRGLLIGNYMCIQKAKQLADSALKLLSSDDVNDHTNALGLYTLAIEEFGKAVILKEECFVDDDEITQKIPKAIFSGKYVHNLKFKKAIERLPPECKDIRVGTYLPFPSGIPTNVQLGMKGPHVPVPANVDGNFFGLYTANVDMRMSCFFVDWDDTQRRWVFKMKGEKKEELESALNTFKEKITDYEIVTMIARKSSSQGAAEGGQSS
jgi:AbiV family abortive infection protein